MKKRNLLVAVLALAAMGCAKMEKKEEMTAPAPQVEAPKMEAMPKPAEPTPAPAASNVRQTTYDSCIERNKDNALYCSCYADEYANRFKDKSAGGEVSVQDKGHIAVQSALACRKHMKKG